MNCQIILIYAMKGRFLFDKQERRQLTRWNNDIFKMLIKACINTEAISTFAVFVTVFFASIQICKQQQELETRGIKSNIQPLFTTQLPIHLNLLNNSVFRLHHIW